MRAEKGKAVPKIVLFLTCLWLAASTFDRSKASNIPFSGLREPLVLTRNDIFQRKLDE